MNKQALKLGLAILIILTAACSVSSEPTGEQAESVQARDMPATLSCTDVSSITGTYTVSYAPVGDAGARADEAVAYVGGERTDQGSPCAVSVNRCTLAESFGSGSAEHFVCGPSSRLTTSGWVTADDAGTFHRDGPAQVITGAITFADGSAYTFRGSLNDGR